MGIVPLQYIDGQVNNFLKVLFETMSIYYCFSLQKTADGLGLTGKEKFSIDINANELKPGQIIDVTTDDGKSFKALAR